ncbi:NYN domain-containing protein [Leifsonia aquatica]|uniref:NYN domain-containing protein n=1 Tax=Leifsonia aquatica TaxID=144185 RepID=UPI0038513C8A
MGTPKPHPPAERLIVYVDGFNLYHGLHQAYGRSLLWIDLVALSRSLRPRSALVGVKYFTAPVLGDPGALSRQAHHQSAMSARNPGLLTVVQGRYQSKNVTCRNCGRAHRVYEEKETDVNIAVALVSDSALGNMDSALIISADSDLAPAVKVAHVLKPNMFITAAFPPERYSNELKSLMPASFKIGRDKLRQAQLPATFTADRATFSRPDKWK